MVDDDCCSDDTQNEGGEAKKTLDTRISVRTKKNQYSNAADNEKTREIDTLME